MENARELLNKFRLGTCADREIQLIERWMLFYGAGEPSDLLDTDFEQSHQDIWKNIQQQLLPKARKLGSG
ncbi:hypothetical protein DBR43_09495 [Pedobacter sp. KBW06]|uniref:hypothetical protein n=1 Tax=Pedobacter sp. KBW06 TaxID=2153359 RepID=UPI000F5B73E6|nr:hypothetical protein [Pedobacter sp. KBW06]RQO75562.1 hypothetical protein DBR43_09495 [Pedobacter sp. KBW06]